MQTRNADEQKVKTDIDTAKLFSQEPVPGLKLTMGFDFEAAKILVIIAQEF